MSRFTLRELESISRARSTSPSQKREIKRYLKSSEAQERRNRAKKRVRTIRRNNNPFRVGTGFRFRL